MEKLIAELEKKIQDIKNRLPAHSVRPAMIEELEDLEEQLAELKAKKDSHSRSASDTERK